jgi:TonB-dependent starch-binding outer membrane protein SusC
MKNKQLQCIVMLTKYTLFSFLLQSILMNVLVAHEGTTQPMQNIRSIKEIRVDVKFNNANLKEVFGYIESKTGLNFIFDEDKISVQDRFTYREKNSTVEEILRMISNQAGLSFRQVNNTISVYRNNDNKKESTIEIFIQTRNITGKVTSQEDKEGLPGVNVIEKGTRNGTVTDVLGNYSLEVSEGATLVFSSVGYTREEVQVGNRVVVNLEMIVDIQQLQELVVVGYGAVTKSDLTGAVSSVKEEELVAYPATNAIQALQGRAAGVTIQSINGEPGGNYKIRIRGATSINASNNPLFVVDGLVGGEMPPPEDIASIEILKDASASAIYGSRGANGVVMITTKSGRSGKTMVNYNSSYSLQQEIGRLDLLNARQFAEYINEARNTNFFDLNALEADTDWQDLIFRPGHMQNHQLSVSGGGDMVNYYVSGSFFDHNGVIKTSAYDRYSLTTNLKFNVSNHVRISLNSILQSSKQDGVRTNSGGGVSGAGVVAAALRFDPNQGILDEDGVYTKSRVGIAAFENPMAVIDGRTEENRQENLQVNTRAEIDITKGLVFNSTFGAIIRSFREGSYDNRISNAGEGNNGLGNMSYRRNYNFLTEQYLNYNFNVGNKNNFVITGGYSYQNFTLESFSASNSGFITDALDFWNLGVGTNLRAPTSNYTESEIVSYYSRVNYNFDNRYLFTVTGRYDGASQFSKGNKWSFFPSGAFSWNVSNEGFYPQNNVISHLKFRTSYGLTGNQAIGPYESLARISSTFFVVNNTSVSSVRPTTIANRDLTWETTAQFNVGLDMELFENRINMTGDYYYKKTNDLLFSVPVPAFSGYQSRLDNLGEIENKGFEFQITSRNLVKTLNWSTNFNLTLNRNKVLTLPHGVDIIYASAPSFTGAVQNSILREGAPVGSFYGFVYEGVYQEGDEFIPGGAFETSLGGEKFADLNNDGVLNSDDRKIIGNPNPKAVWGLNNDFSYKGIKVNVFFQAFTGGDMLNLVKMELDRLSGNSNATTDVLNRWTPENTNTNIPKAAVGRVPRTSTRFVEDGSFVRLKNISIGYDFSSELLSKLRISSARVYVSGQNLLTFTKYSGVDPEVAFRSSNVNLGLDYDSYPNTSSYTFGINLGI